MAAAGSCGRLPSHSTPRALVLPTIRAPHPSAVSSRTLWATGGGVPSARAGIGFVHAGSPTPSAQDRWQWPLRTTARRSSAVTSGRVVSGEAFWCCPFPVHPFRLLSPYLPPSPSLPPSLPPCSSHPAPCSQQRLPLRRNGARRPTANHRRCPAGSPLWRQPAAACGAGWWWRRRRPRRRSPCAPTCSHPPLRGRRFGHWQLSPAGGVHSGGVRSFSSDHRVGPA